MTINTDSAPADPLISFTKEEQLGMVHGLRLNAYMRIRMVLTATRSDRDKLRQIEEIMAQTSREITLIMSRRTTDGG